ncbi:uncharacterized protein LOC114543805 [Dendronephthya gigantea]|uniref:uncharacterized protein LOC114543805 n=1 Tax=Dendronephthya gigantea TaxID=151771 RepID=UPI00106B1643|nr:uncharacterized protein LOC114543805 [Dendronephthya gigantea]
MALYHKIHSKSILFALLLIFLLPCTYGENYDVFEDEAEIASDNKLIDISSENEGDEPSENKFLRIGDVYRADFGPWRVTPTPRIDVSLISKSTAAREQISSTKPRRIKATPSAVFLTVQQTPTRKTPTPPRQTTRFVFRTTRRIRQYRTTRRPLSFTSRRPRSTSRPQNLQINQLILSWKQSR